MRHSTPERRACIRIIARPSEQIDAEIVGLSLGITQPRAIVTDAGEQTAVDMRL